jgi:hypothetical protein
VTFFLAKGLMRRASIFVSKLFERLKVWNETA